MNNSSTVNPGAQSISNDMELTLSPSEEPSPKPSSSQEFCLTSPTTDKQANSKDDENEMVDDFIIPLMK